MATEYENSQKLNDLTVAFEELYTGDEDTDVTYDGTTKPSFDKRFKQIIDEYGNIVDLTAQATVAAESAIGSVGAAAGVANQYASTADALSNGLKTVAITGAGSGGTDNQYIIPVTGSTGSNGKILVVISGGVLTEASILVAGKDYTGTAVADIDSAAGTTGATVSITIAPNRNVGDYFTIPSVITNGALDVWEVETGPVATFTDVTIAAPDTQVTYIYDYEYDLCGFSVVEVDANFIIISQADAEDPGSVSVLEATVVNARRDVAWIEKSGVNYQLKGYGALSGVVTNLGSANSNKNPAIDDDGRVVYVRNGTRYWQDVNGGTEYPFNPTATVVGWGDSMTAGGSGYGDIFKADYPALNYSSQGLGAQRAEHIAARAEGLETFVVIDGDEIPASGSVVVTSLGIDLLFTGGMSVRDILVSVAGVEGELVRTGATGEYTFERSSSGDAVTVSADGELMTILTGLAQSETLIDTQKRINIFWAGRNDVAEVDYSQAAIMESVAAMVRTQKAFCREYLVIGVTNGIDDIPTSMGGLQPTEEDSAVILNNIINLNAALAETYGDLYVDMLTELDAANPSYFTTYNISGTNYDVLDATFSSDGLHGNTTGRTSVSTIIYNTLVAKGWV